jgi:alpha-L-arabinofuranosidase
MFAHAKGDRVVPVARIVPQSIPAAESAPEPQRDSPGRFGRGEAPPDPREPLFACASREEASGDILLKVVNVFGADQTLAVELLGAPIRPVATGEVLTGEPGDVNTVEDPFHIVPRRFVITDASPRWTHTFPGHSVTVLRFKTAK